MRFDSPQETRFAPNGGVGNLELRRDSSSQRSRTSRAAPDAGLLWFAMDCNLQAIPPRLGSALRCRRAPSDPSLELEVIRGFESGPARGLRFLGEDRALEE